MIVTRLHCDGCHREIDWYEGYPRERVARGWIYVTRTDTYEDGDGADDWHLCSWDCAAAWLARTRPTAIHLLPEPVVA